LGFSSSSLQEILDEIASETPAPGGGSVAALVGAMAAGLAAMAARFSPDWEPARETARRADALRARLVPLADADAAAFEQVLAAMRVPKELEAEVRNRLIGDALSRAADVPLLIAEAAAEVAELGALAAAGGNTNLRGDATAGAVLGEAATRVAANLVEINLGTAADDERIARGRELVQRASAAAKRALALG
jgi:formiminotetrahydrofolate cyclodeaminase